jgi:hypothetical protein
MPLFRDCSQLEGEAEPASAFLSPVARDYPSRALRRFFMPATLRLFHQRTGAPCAACPGLSRLCFTQLINICPKVNNLAVTLCTGYSRHPKKRIRPDLRMPVRCLNS